MRMRIDLVWGQLHLRLLWNPLQFFFVNENVDEDEAEARN